MIRLSLRQLRAQAIVAAGGLAVIAAIVAVTHRHIAEAYRKNVLTCASHGDCDTARDLFLRTDDAMQLWLGILVIVVPGLVGVFWGAPLIAREIEAGTHRLAWTQSVTRTRWAATKIGVVGLAGMVVAGLLSLMVTWWSGLFDKVGEDLYGTYDRRDLVPIGYAAFAFALGVTAGVVIRRPVPAMATTLFVFVVTRVAFVLQVRPSLVAPSHRNFTLDPTATGLGRSDGGATTLHPVVAPIPNGWIHSNHIVDGSGHRLSQDDLSSLCPNLDKIGGPPPGGPSRVRAPDGLRDVLHDCVTKVGGRFHGVTTYHPANRYWDLQWLELGIYLVAAVVLAGLSVWFIRRRIG